jgi:hypothetical protein
MGIKIIYLKCCSHLFNSRVNTIVVSSRNAESTRIEKAIFATLFSAITARITAEATETCFALNAGKAAFLFHENVRPMAIGADSIWTHALAQLGPILDHGLFTDWCKILDIFEQSNWLFS